MVKEVRVDRKMPSLECASACEITGKINRAFAMISMLRETNLMADRNKMKFQATFVCLRGKVATIQD